MEQLVRSKQDVLGQVLDAITKVGLGLQRIGGLAAWRPIAPEVEWVSAVYRTVTTFLMDIIRRLSKRSLREFLLPISTYG